MSNYKGFISFDTYKELCNLLDSIADFRGIKNSIVHMRTPDTDMKDQICEDFERQKEFTARQLVEKLNALTDLALKIYQLRRDE